MEQVWVWIVRALGATGAFLAGLLGGWDATLCTLVIAMSLDFLTGLMVAFVGKSTKTEGGGISSGAATKGILKKMALLVVMSLSVAVDRFIGTPGTLRIVVSTFYVANESLSILENTVLLGLPCPPPLRAALEALKDKSSGEPPTVV